MKFAKEYKIKYYSPYDQVNSIKEETKWGSKITLDFPEMDTLDIVLFEAFLMGGNFKSMSSDSTNEEKRISKEPKDKSNDEVLVYPNPNNGRFIVNINNIEKVNNIEIVDQLGRTVDVRSNFVRENQFSKTKLSPGNYWVKVVFTDQVIRKKLIKH